MLMPRVRRIVRSDVDAYLPFARCGVLPVADAIEMTPFWWGETGWSDIAAASAAVVVAVWCWRCCSVLLCLMIDDGL